MEITLWYLIVGALLVSMALSIAMVRRLPLTPAMLYLAVGVVLGPWAFGLIKLDPLKHSILLERLSEIAVTVSLFTTGLKLRTPLLDRRWMLPLRLAFGSMFITVLLIAAVGYWLLNLPLGLAILLGGILAPTDPVLASDVQVEHPWDHDRLRFGLTGEAGLNDGAAFPFVMLGLGMLGLHDLGSGWWKWITIDVVWATAGGLLIGSLVGWAIGRLVIFLRSKRKEAAGLDELLALGLLALSYGAALAAHTYGFLAVFAAGLALRRIEASSRHTPDAGESADEEVATPPNISPEAAHQPETVPAYMASAILSFSEQLERLLEVGMVLLLGGMLATQYVPASALWFTPLLLLVIRPIAVGIGLIGEDVTARQRRMIKWFGIRGVGSIYYLTYAINHGLVASDGALLTGLVFTTAAVSIAAHGISVTPLMKIYSRHGKPADRASPRSGV